MRYLKGPEKDLAGTSNSLVYFKKALWLLIDLRLLVQVTDSHKKKNEKKILVFLRMITKGYFVSF